MAPKRHLSAFAAVCLMTLAASLVACAGSTDAPADRGGPAAADETSALVPALAPLHTSTVKVSGTERAMLDTEKGIIEIEFYADKAPNTVACFIELARSGLYDGTRFHRVLPGEFIQGGDPLSKTNDPKTGLGGPGWRQRAEFNDQKHVAGAVSMARTDAGPDTAGSQFFIALVPLGGLDGKYTVFGRVVKGMDVAGTVTAGTVIRSVKIEGSPGS